ncbi:tetratricopeptide repeat protein [Methylosoma difficile]
MSKKLRTKIPPPKKPSVAKPPLQQPSDEQINHVVALYKQGDFDGVEQQAKVLIKQFPQHNFGWKALGAVLPQLGRLEESLEVQLKSVQLSPSDAEALYNLGNTYKALKRLDDAVKTYQQAIAIKPHFSEVYNNLGLSLHDLGRLTEAANSYQTALAQQPQNAELHYNFGITLRELGNLCAAEQSYRQAIALNPRHTKAYNNLGNVLKDVGRLPEAEHCYNQAIAINPNDIDAQSNLLYTFDYKTNYSPAVRLSHARRYGEIAAQQAGKTYTNWQCPTPAKPLRVGFVSGDLCNHPVSFFLKSLLAHTNSADIEFYAYVTRTKNDDVNAQLRPYFTAWQSLEELDDEAAAKLIHHDSIHILIDLAGHTAHNRLPLFAWKAAPIQISWLGYWASTGVKEMDYFFADTTGVPEHLRWQFTEQVYYLPNTRLCFSAPDAAIPVSGLPALRNGHITFGCFQNLSKVTDPVLALWGRILAQLPNARLRLQSKQFFDGQFTDLFYQRLATQGIKPEQVSIHKANLREQYLAAHAEVDFILDTFPYNGGTTTCEALWMGVPTLTLLGETLLARQGASLLSAAGLTDWIADDPQSYADKAIAFATDIHRLVQLRQNLRQQVLASPLFDGQQFARHFETALQDIWQQNQLCS